MEEVKPGWQSSEFWTAIVTQFLSLLVIAGVVKSTDQTSLQGALAAAITSAFTILASAAVVIQYIRSRTAVKTAQPPPPVTIIKETTTNKGSGSVLSLAFAGLLLFSSGAAAQSVPEMALVRLPSHGLSGTCIAAGKGKSLILSAAHGFSGHDRTRPIQLDYYTPTASREPLRVKTRLARVDYAADLALVEIDLELPYYCPVAPAGFQARSAISAGFDNGILPRNDAEIGEMLAGRPTHILFSDGNHTITSACPWHGRSGGALIAHEGGPYLIGVVSGYGGQSRRSWQESGRGQGIYASLAAIHRFLGQPEGPALAVEIGAYYGPRRPAPMVHQPGPRQRKGVAGCPT